MANMHLVTGYAGKLHVTAADQGSLYAALFGGASFVLDRGSKLAATVVTNNLVRIADGDIIMQGRHARIESGLTVDLSIDNGASGHKRNDLIVARYTKSSDTGVEAINLVVIKGAAVTGAAADPAYVTGNIVDGGAAQADFPLYRVPIDGLNVGTLVPLFDLFGTIPAQVTAIATATDAQVAALAATHTLATYNSLTKLGLSGAVTTEQVVKAMPDWSMLVLNNSVSSVLTAYVSDAPTTYGNLELIKVPARATARYHASGTSAGNLTHWVGCWHNESGWSGWIQQARQDALDAEVTRAKAAESTAQSTANTAKTNAATAQTAANAAMPKSGGTFTGNVKAYDTNRDTVGGCLRNIAVTDSTGNTLQTTNRITMRRK